MSWLGLPCSYFAYALLQVLTPLLMWLAGATEVHPFASVSLIWLLLVIALGFRSAVAWGVLFAWHVFFLCIPVVADSPPASTAEVAMMLISATSIALLVCRPMRRHLDGPPDRAVPPPSPSV